MKPKFIKPARPAIQAAGELPMPDEDFRLITETGNDGDSIASRRQKAALDRAQAEKLQTSLL